VHREGRGNKRGLVRHLPYTPPLMLVVMSDNKEYTIKKIDAAIRQLDIAIRMWFQEDDIIATHVLACSAHEIIKDINMHQKGHHLIFDNPYIKEKYRTDFINALKNHYNFFKHANIAKEKDPECTIAFNPLITEYFILASSIGLEELKIKPSSFRIAFTRYQMIHNSGFFDLSDTTIESIPPDYLAQIKSLNRKQFLECATHFD